MCGVWVNEWMCWNHKLSMYVNEYLVENCVFFPVHFLMIISLTDLGDALTKLCMEYTNSINKQLGLAIKKEKVVYALKFCNISFTFFLFFLRGYKIQEI